MSSMLPNHGFQVAHRFFHQTFDFAHMCAPVWVTTTHLGLPLPAITDWHTPHPPPGLVPCPSHSPITLGNPKVDSRMCTHTHACLIGAPSTVTTCASKSGSRMRRNPTGDDRVSSMHEHGSGA